MYARNVRTPLCGNRRAASTSAPRQSLRLPRDCLPILRMDMPASDVADLAHDDLSPGIAPLSVENVRSHADCRGLVAIVQNGSRGQSERLASIDRNHWSQSPA